MKKIIGIICVLILCVSISARQRQVKDAVHDLESDIQKSFSSKGKRALHKKKHEISYDRSYYDSLIENASKRHWAFTGAVYYSSEDKGYDACGSSVPLSATVFGQCHITIEDIYLFSRLSDDNKVRIDNCNARAPERGGVSIGGTGVVFGGFRDDLYTTLLAPIELVFDADQKEVSFITSGIFRCEIGEQEHFSLGIGYTIPIKSVRHDLTFTYTGGELFRRGFVPDTTQRETALNQFFRDYSSVEDFIARAVLEPKGLAFDNEQRKSGIGDVSVFVLMEYHNNHVFEFGLNIVFPTASTGDTNNVWEPVLGSGGAYFLNPFAQLLLSSTSPYCNPLVRVAVEVGSSFTTKTTRAPTLVTNDQRKQVQNVSGLSAPEQFQAFYVDAFQEFDSTVPFFAGKTPFMNQKVGPKFMFGVGNYAYNLFHFDIRWGLFYDYYFKARDSFCRAASIENTDCSGVTIDSCSLERVTDQRAHIISTSITYKRDNTFELGVGGQFTVAGKNVSQGRNFYISLVAMF